MIGTSRAYKKEDLLSQGTGPERGGERDGTGVKKPRSKMTVVKGVVIPTDWDEHGNVVALAISSNDEKEYIVDNKGKGKELLGLIRKEVEVRGVITEEDQRKIIKVRKYTLAEHSEPEESFPS
jgi:hypothetical protein